VLEIFVNLTCIKRKLVYSEYKSWFQGCSVYTGFTVIVLKYRSSLKGQVSMKTQNDLYNTESNIWFQ